MTFSPVEIDSILCTTHKSSCGSFFLLQRCNRSSEPGILLLGFETVNILFNHLDPGPIFDNVQNEHVLVVIWTNYGFRSTTGVHNNLVRGLVRDQTMDCSLELMEIGEDGFVSSTIAFANAEISAPMNFEAEVDIKCRERYSADLALSISG